jgi:hypothetical protein
MHAAQDRGVLRIAGWLTAAAASILVGALLLHPSYDRTENTSMASAAWQIQASMPPASSELRGEGGAGSDVVVLAQWMNDELQPAPDGAR